MSQFQQPDLRTVCRISTEALNGPEGNALATYLKEAQEYLLFYKWCGSIVEEYVGMLVDGIIGIFLFRIVPTRPGVDEWIWVIVGDIPPTYLTCEICPDPGTALDGYISAMSEWVDAAYSGKSVANLIPVDVPATKENAELLRKRLDFLDQRILAEFRREQKEGQSQLLHGSD